MLCDPAQFEPLTDEPWDEARVRDAIAAIVADADAAFSQAGLWPAHEWDGYKAALPLKNLYVGAAGVVWALAELRERGQAESALDLPDVAVRVRDRLACRAGLDGGRDLAGAAGIGASSSARPASS